MIVDSANFGSLLSRARDLLDAGGGRLPFYEQIPVRMNAATLWFELEKALCNSQTSQIWPSEFATVRSDGLEPFAVLEVDYKFFFTRAVYHYKITDFEKGRRFQYSAMKDHIFEGGGTVEIRAQGRGCILNWSGEYRFDKVRSPHALMFKLYFQERFFEQLRENLRRFEQQLGNA